MKKIILVLFVGLILGCATSQDLIIKVEKAPSDYKVLIGEFSGSVALMNGSPKNASIRAVNGDFLCEGVSDNGRFETDLVTRNKISHTFNINCSDGSTGLIPVKINAYAGGRVQGVGLGTLSNGSKIKILVGDLSASVEW